MRKDSEVKEAVMVAALTMLGAEPFQAKPGEDKILSRFVGKWEGEGKHMTTPMRVTAEYDWALGKQFLKGELKAAAGAFTYEATIFFKQTEKEGRFTVTWLDNLGNVINSTMVASGKTLTMEWIEKTPQGDHPAKSEITLLDEGWIDRSFGKQGDKWIEFGSTTFKRK
jgi:hypothetical protein